MKTKRVLRLLNVAEKDIEESAKWYNNQREALGIEFIDEVDKTIKSIENNPEQFQKVHQKKNIRRAAVHRFPFLVFYAIERMFITVLAVFHTSQHPKKWNDKTRWE